MADFAELMAKCGWAAWPILAAVVLAAVGTLGAWLLVLTRSRVAWPVALVAVVVAALPLVFGFAGRGYGRSQTDQAVAGSQINPDVREEMRQVGYAESDLCAKFGGIPGAVCLLLAGAAAILAAHRRRAAAAPIAADASRPNSRAVPVTGAILALAVTAAVVAGLLSGKSGASRGEPAESAKPARKSPESRHRPDPEDHAVAPETGGAIRRALEQAGRGKAPDAPPIAPSAPTAPDTNPVPAGAADGEAPAGDLAALRGLGAIDNRAGASRSTGPRKRGKVNIAQGTSNGGCDKGDIAKNVRARAASIKACYEQQLLTKPDLQGKLTVQWTITTEGAVKDPKATQDTIGTPAVSECVIRTLSRIRFAKPEAGICVVQWPFAFAPG